MQKFIYFSNCILGGRSWLKEFGILPEPVIRYCIWRSKTSKERIFKQFCHHIGETLILNDGDRNVDEKDDDSKKMVIMMIFIVWLIINTATKW